MIYSFSHYYIKEDEELREYRYITPNGSGVLGIKLHEEIEGLFDWKNHVSANVIPFLVKIMEEAIEVDKKVVYLHDENLDEVDTYATKIINMKYKDFVFHEFYDRNELIDKVKMIEYDGFSCIVTPSYQYMDRIKNLLSLI